MENGKGCRVKTSTTMKSGNVRWPTDKNYIALDEWRYLRKLGKIGIS
jgi:hypothetical protein